MTNVVTIVATIEASQTNSAFGDLMPNDSPRPIGEIISDILPKYLATQLGPNIDEQLQDKTLIDVVRGRALWPPPK